jgi:AcrR family transcriptional regulator
MQQRRPGRPAAESDGQAVHEALLEAARQQFSRHGYNGVSIRRLATAAGVNSSMIHYYFGGKRGLYEAMLAEALRPLFGQLRDIAAAKDNDRLAAFVSAHMHHLAQRPWLAALVVRDVLAQEGELREHFLREYAEPGGQGILSALMQDEIRAGRMRRDLDPRMTALSVISLTVFPFLALPVASRVFGVETREAFVSELVKHTIRLIREGVGAPADREVTQ